MSTGRGRGRPRDEQLTDNAIESALALLSQDGFETLTIEAVARRTGVSRPAIYKRWPTLADLILDSAIRARDKLVAAKEHAGLTAPDTGSLSSDLRTYTRQGMDLLAKLEDAGVTRALLAESIRSPSLAARVRETLFTGDEDTLIAVFERAVARGEVADGQDVRCILETLVGYALFRKYTLHDTLDDEGLDHLCDLLVRGMRAEAS